MTAALQTSSSSRDANAPGEPVIILNLHGIGTPRRELPDGEKKFWIDSSLFEALLDFAKERDDIEFTFDDANESDHSIALPALQRRGIKAQFFLVADRIGRPDYLSRRQVGDLLKAGMTLGSHGMRHRPWTGLDADELREELVEAKARLEEWTGIPIERAACPFGSYDRRVITQLQRAGFRRIYTSDGGWARSDDRIQPRNSVCRDDNLEVIRRWCSNNASGVGGLWRGLKQTVKRWR